MATTLPMKTSNLFASEANVMTAQKAVKTQPITIQPDEAFLEFLASMSEIDGEMTDPLDMLELSESEILDASGEEAEIIPIVELKNKQKIKPDQAKSNQSLETTNTEGKPEEDLDTKSEMKADTNIKGNLETMAKENRR